MFVDLQHAQLTRVLVKPHLFLDIPLEQIEPSPLNPRQKFDEESLRELAESIRAHGLLQPIVVRPIAPASIDQTRLARAQRKWMLGEDSLREIVRQQIENVVAAGGRAAVHPPGPAPHEDIVEVYRDEGRRMGLIVEVGPRDPATWSAIATARPADQRTYSIVAGERRYRACRLAGLDNVRCVIIEDVDDKKALEVMLVENLQRRDLDPVEEARGYAQLQQLGYRQTQIAAAVNRSQPAIANRMRLLDLPEDVLERIRSGELSPAHGVALARFTDYPAVVSTIAECAVANKSTSKFLEENNVPFDYQLVSKGLARTLDRYATAFDIASCRECRHRRKGNLDWSGDLCLDPDCYRGKEAKAKAAREAEVAAKLEQVRAAKAAAGEVVESVVDVSSLPYDSYVELYTPVPAGCKARDCDKYVEGIRYDRPVVVCTDPKCHKRLLVAETKAKAKAEREDAEAKLKRISQLTSDWQGNDGAPLITSRELAPIIAYALTHVHDGDAVKEAFAGNRIPDYGSASVGRKQIESMAQLAPAALVRCALTAILLYEQRTRLQKDKWHDPGTWVSDFYLAEASADG